MKISKNNKNTKDPYYEVRKWNSHNWIHGHIAFKRGSWVYVDWGDSAYYTLNQMEQLTKFMKNLDKPKVALEKRTKNTNR